MVDGRPGLAGDMRTGGDIPLGKPSKESSSVSSGIGVRGFREEEDLDEWNRFGVREDGSLRSTTPVHLLGSVSAGRYGLNFLGTGVLGLNFNGETPFMVNSSEGWL